MRLLARVEPQPTYDPDAVFTPPPVAPEGAPRRARPAWLRPGLRVAAIAAAATGGVLVRFGIASGAGALGTFTLLGRLVTGVTAVDGALAQHAATGVGVLVHLLVVTVWAMAFAIVASGTRGLRRWPVAFLVAAFAWGAGQYFLPTVLRLGHGARARSPQIALLHVVLALSLAIGMRLALGERDER